MGKFVKNHAKTLKEWYGASISGDDTLDDLYSRLSTGELDGKCLSLEYETVVADVRVGKSVAATFTKVHQSR